MKVMKVIFSKVTGMEYAMICDTLMELFQVTLGVVFGKHPGSATSL